MVRMFSELHAVAVELGCRLLGKDPQIGFAILTWNKGVPKTHVAMTANTDSRAALANMLRAMADQVETTEQTKVNGIIAAPGDASVPSLILKPGGK